MAVSPQVEAARRVQRAWRMARRPTAALRGMVVARVKATRSFAELMAVLRAPRVEWATKAVLARSTGRRVNARVFLAAYLVARTPEEVFVDGVDDALVALARATVEAFETTGAVTTAFEARFMAWKREDALKVEGRCRRALAALVEASTRMVLPEDLQAMMARLRAEFGSP